MSNLVVPDSAKIPVMNTIYTPSWSLCRLFKNNATISHSTVKADLTVGDFGGYTDGALTGAVTDGALDASNRAVIHWDAITFTRSSGPDQTIYGYWLEDISGNMLAVEKFDTPIPFTVNGTFVVIVPKFTGASQYLNS